MDKLSPVHRTEGFTRPYFRLTTLWSKLKFQEDAEGVASAAAFTATFFLPGAIIMII